jgi:hypothetical protein
MRSRAIALLLPAVFGLVLAACGAPEETDKPLAIESYTKVMKTGKKLVDPVHGEETGFWYGAVGGEKSNGVAYIYTFQDGASVVTLNLNVLPAEKGTRYHAYLLSDDGKKEVDLGELRSIIGDARHSLKFETTESIEGMLRVEVKLLKGLLSGSETVALGTLKVPAEPEAL